MLQMSWTGAPAAPSCVMARDAKPPAKGTVQQSLKAKLTSAAATTLRSREIPTGVFKNDRSARQLEEIDSGLY